MCLENVLCDYIIFSPPGVPLYLELGHLDNRTSYCPKYQDTSNGVLIRDVPLSDVTQNHLILTIVVKWWVVGKSHWQHASCGN